MPARRPSPSLVFCGARVNADARVMLLPDGAEVPLRDRDVGVIVALTDTEGSILTRGAMARAVWGAGADPAGRSVDQYVAHLRRVLAKHGGNPELLRTVHGLGWVLLPSPPYRPRARKTRPA